ncbi:hypothetical protein [Streptomyces narbonensis]|nr:hypothetical protein [Streptomyces narbonensis]
MDVTAAGLNDRRIAATCFAELHSTLRAEAIASWLGTRPTR